MIGNACGLPVLALPCGFGRERLPAGFQIMGPPFSEDLLLDLGDAYQKRTSWHLERPPLQWGVQGATPVDHPAGVRSPRLSYGMPGPHSAAPRARA